MTNLDSIWARWIELYDDLSRDSDFGAIAEPFLSIPPTAKRSILYVGQATSKDGPCSDLPIMGSANANEKRIKDRCKCTQDFIISEAPSYNGDFWRFAIRLNSEAADKWKSENKDPLQHITWSNLFKIGSQIGNPRSRLRNRQAELAVETLRAEIRTYRPNLVYFVTGDYGHRVIGRVLDDPEHDSWDKTMSNDGLWARKAKDGLPPFVWTYHPRAKSTKVRDLWLNGVLEFLPD